MSKQTAESPSAAQAEEQQSSTGVMDAPPEVDRQQLKQEHNTAKERQKDRISGHYTYHLIELYRQMLLIRHFEEKAAEVYVAGRIGGFCHLYIGQEAVGVGAISAIRKDDYVLTSYREHGQAIAKGMSPKAVMAELYGKATGCSHGKGGATHLFDTSLNFLGGQAIGGGQIPLGRSEEHTSELQSRGHLVCRL